MVMVYAEVIFIYFALFSYMLINLIIITILHD